MPGSKPPAFMLSITSGACKAFSVPRRSFSLMAIGVPVGTDQSDHEVTTRAGKPDSAKVGVLGEAPERLAPVVAIAFSLPALTWLISESMLPMHIGRCPASTSAAANEAPR